MAYELTLAELEKIFVRVDVLTAVCGIGERAIQVAATKMEEDPKIGKGKYLLIAFIKQYIAGIQGGSVTRSDIDPGYEAARVDKERADQLAIRNAQARGELRDVESFLMVNAQIAQIHLSGLAALPGRCASRLAAELGANPEIVRRLIQAEVDEQRRSIEKAFRDYAAGAEDLDEQPGLSG